MTRHTLLTAAILALLAPTQGRAACVNPPTCTMDDLMPNSIGSLPLLVSPSLEDRSWHLLTQSRGGAVSLLRDLTLHECAHTRARLLGFPETKEELAEAAKSRVYSGVHIMQPGDITSAECFQ